MRGEVEWIKITTSMFNDEKIKLIESMPEKDTLLIIWIKLLVQAGKTNASGYVFLNENIPYNDEMLAVLFDRPVSSVRLALSVFEKFGMIELSDENGIAVLNWEKHQNVTGLEKIKENNRVRQQRHREKQKQLGKSEKKHIQYKKEEEEELELETCVTRNVTITLPKKLIPDNLINDNFIEAWEMWKKYNVEKKKKLTESTMKLQLKKLSHIGVEKSIERIERSITNNYVGLFFKGENKNNNYGYGKIEQPKEQPEEEIECGSSQADIDQWEDEHEEKMKTDPKYRAREEAKQAEQAELRRIYNINHGIEA